MPTSRPGFFGKLPSHGDFIQRGLPGAMLEALDAWLQQAVAVSREQLAERWLDTYMTSPLWRFALTPGCLDGNGWLGLLTPSVDSVGRYYPLVIAAPLPMDSAPVATLLAAGDWFGALEDAALSALQDPLTADDLNRRLDCLPSLAAEHRTAGRIGQQAPLSAEPAGAAEMTRLLDWSCAASANASSIWRTAGSERIQPCLAMARGMPDSAGFAAMLDGQWRQWGWNGEANFA